MKKNDWAIIISVLLYSLLFYKQSAGINFLLFNMAIVGILLYRDVSLLKSKVWLAVALGALVSSFFIFMYGSALAIVANLFSLFILSAISINTKTSFITGIFLTICSVGLSFMHIFLDWIKRKSSIITETSHRPLYVKLFLIIIPFLITILFFIFYQSANPLFYEFTKDINFDFISIGWIFFTLSGLLLMYGFFHNRRIHKIVELDSSASLNLTPELASRNNFFNNLMRIDTEYISGIVLFSMLNVLLLMVNVLDLNYLWLDGTLPKGIKHKEFVHDGIGTLITSIVVAIFIILFYFRGELNYYKDNKWIRIMAYIWIIQNAFMIFSTAYRNDMYIEESGLSYKKIGVYVYLLLTLIGLTTTFIKVWKLKTNWYLFRVNAVVCYFFLVLSCVFNWDVIITNFNIKKYTEENKELEKYLLLDLSFKNLPQLLSLSDSVASKDDYKARDYYYHLRGVYFKNFKSGLHIKLYKFLEEYQELEWQSLCFEKKRVYRELFVKKDQIQYLNLNGTYLQSLKPLGIYNNLHVLKFNGNYLKELNELKLFPVLERLDLSSNRIDTLTKFPSLKKLRELNLAENKIKDITPLSNLANLEVLNLSGNNHIVSYAPLLALNNLKHLTIGRITPDGLNTLKRTFPNVKIDANVDKEDY
ncbi:MAG: DUF4153 domain-containing protein [Bacteroidota bacterium]